MAQIMAESPATNILTRQMEPEDHQALVQPLEQVACARVLVVGGGVAGQQAALDAAALGLPVTLVEAGPSIGGSPPVPRTPTEGPPPMLGETSHEAGRGA